MVKNLFKKQQRVNVSAAMDAADGKILANKDLCMKKLIATCFALCVSAALWGQQPVPEKFFVELGSGTGIGVDVDRYDKITVHDLSVSFGYDLSKRFSLKVPLTLSWGEYEWDDMWYDKATVAAGERLYSRNEFNGSLGLGAGYNVVVKPNSRLQLTAEAGSSIYEHKDSWRYIYGDAGLKFYMGAPHNRANGFVGLGVRGLRAESAYLTDNCTMLYISLGFRLNSFRKK